MQKATTMPVVGAVTALNEEIARRVKLGKEKALSEHADPTSVGYAEEFALLLSRKLLQFVSYLLKELKFEFDNLTGELSWRAGSDKTDDPAKEFEEALVRADGLHILAYLRQRSEELSAASLRTELSAFRTMYRILQEQGRTTFDPEEIRNPNSRSNRVPLVEEFLAEISSDSRTRNSRRYELSFYIAHICSNTGIEVVEELEQEATDILRSTNGEPDDDDELKLIQTLTGQIVLYADAHLPTFIETLEGADNAKHVLSSVRGLYRHLNRERLGTYELSEIRREKTSSEVSRKKKKAKRRKQTKVVTKVEPQERDIFSPVVPEAFRTERRMNPSYDDFDVAEFTRLRNAALERLICVEQLEFGDLTLLSRGQWRSARGLLKVRCWSPTEAPLERTVRLSRETQELLQLYAEVVRDSPLSYSPDGSKPNPSAPLFLATDGGRLVVDDGTNSYELSPGFFYCRNRAITMFMRELGSSFETTVEARRAVIDLGLRRVYPPAAAEAPHQKISDELTGVLHAWFSAVNVSPLRNFWTQNEHLLPLFLAADGAELTTVEL